MVEFLEFLNTPFTIGVVLLVVVLAYVNYKYPGWYKRLIDF